VTVADRNADARQHATRSGVQKVASTLAELPECDGIVIATTSSTHATVIEEALSQGVPVFVEKPMVCDGASAQRLAASAKLFVMDKWRYHPGIEELRRIRENGELGRPMGMHLRHVGWGLGHQDVDATWILLPHALSILQEVLGQIPEVVHAFAEQIDGRALTLTGSLGPLPWAMIEVSSRSPVKCREFRLHCEEGIAWLDDGWSSHIKIVRGAQGTGGDARNVEERPISQELPLWRELRAFVQHLAGGPAPRSAAKEGALIVERILQLRSRAGLSCPTALAPAAGLQIQQR
jgi:predicted dehydrogenase